MRVELGVSQASLRRWQVEIACRLDRLPGVSVGSRWSRAVGEPLPVCANTLLGLERALHGSPAALTIPAEPTALSPYVGHGGTNTDLVIDLGGGTPVSGQRRWRLTFDGGAGDVPIVGALLDGRAPVVALVDAIDGGIIAEALPGLPDDGSVASGFEAVMARTVNLVVSAVGGGRGRLRMTASPSTVSCNDAVARATRSLSEAARARLSRIGRRPTHARTGWRFVTGPDVVDLGSHPACGWQVLPDDGARSYAHPFPIVRRSESWLFVTERDFARDKSLISAVQFGPRGPLQAPSPVLELPEDLAFPHVFEAEGNVWMIPERSGGTSIDLYRASRFPGGWRHEACLVEDVEASGATPFRHGGRWWMSATVHDGSAVPDMMHLWSSPDLRGPWRAHPRNPVLIDAETARSAGRVVERGGRLIRPVRSRTSRGIALVEVLRLDEDSFDQRVVAELGVGPLWPGQGISTLNRAGSIECIDGADFAVAIAPQRPARDDAPGWSRQPAEAH